MFVCPVPKISQVKMKRRRRASHLGGDTLWYNGRWAISQLGRFTSCGTTAAEPLQYSVRFTLCGTAAAELLHHSVDLLCGTTAAELLGNSVDLLGGTTAACMHQESHTFSKDSDEPCWKYEGLIQSKILLRVLNALEDSTNTWQTQIDIYALRRHIESRTHETPCELEHQSEAKRKQSLHSEANVCRHKCNLENWPPLLIAQDTQ